MNKKFKFIEHLKEEISFLENEKVQIQDGGIRKEIPLNSWNCVQWRIDELKEVLEELKTKK